MTDRQQTQIDGHLREGTGENNTPLKWVEPIARAVGGFDLDPCASRDSQLAAENVRESGGLERDWSRYDTIWVNHPYARGEAQKWLSAAKEAVGGEEPRAETVVTLSKNDTPADWFHENLLDATVLCFPDQRIRFVGHENGAKWGNVFGVFGTCPARLRDWFEATGWVTEP